MMASPTLEDALQSIHRLGQQRAEAKTNIEATEKELKPPQDRVAELDRQLAAQKDAYTSAIDQLNVSVTLPDLTADLLRVLAKYSHR